MGAISNAYLGTDHRIHLLSVRNHTPDSEEQIFVISYMDAFTPLSITFSCAKKGDNEVLNASSMVVTGVTHNAFKAFYKEMMMNKPNKPTLVALIVASTLALSACSDSDDDSSENRTPEAVYQDRLSTEVVNIRSFGDSLIATDAMMFESGVLPAELKWKLHTYQMIRIGNEHGQARGAYQLFQLGTPLTDIYALWDPDYIYSIQSPEIKVAFEYFEAAKGLPNNSTAANHRSLRQFYIDRQIVELFVLASVGVMETVSSKLNGEITDNETLSWAQQYLSEVNWQPGIHQGPEEEQRKLASSPEFLSELREELKESYHPEFALSPAPHVSPERIEQITGIAVPYEMVDEDKDGVEDVYEPFYLVGDVNEWNDDDNDGIGKQADLDDDNDNISDIEEIRRGTNPNNPDTDGDGLRDDVDKNPLDNMPVFDIAKYDVDYRTGYNVPTGKDAAYMDRQYLDVFWSRRVTSLGIEGMDGVAYKDGALPSSFKWTAFLVQQIASQCIHCQVHGAYGMHIHGAPDEEIYSMWDFERSEFFNNAEKAAFRVARDIATMPVKLSAGHIEELRRYYTNREIQELYASLINGAFLSSFMQSHGTVTDEESMSWAEPNLKSVGFNPGIHRSADPAEQRGYYMDSLAAAVESAVDECGSDANCLADIDIFDFAIGNGKTNDADVPLDIDTDSDGIADAYDGYPNDPRRWADFDGDGIENSIDDDIDGDGLSNDEELNLGTSLVRFDSDRDGISDAEEVKLGTDPWTKN